MIDEITFGRDGSTTVTPDSNVVIDTDDQAIDYSRLCSPKSVSLIVCPFFVTQIALLSFKFLTFVVFYFRACP